MSNARSLVTLLSSNMYVFNDQNALHFLTADAR
jgi:hypothetical protein